MACRAAADDVSALLVVELNRIRADRPRGGGPDCTPWPVLLVHGQCELLLQVDAAAVAAGVLEELRDAVQHAKREVAAALELTVPLHVEVSSDPGREWA